MAPASPPPCASCEPPDFIARPSSQARPRAAPGICKRDANPCSVFVPSECGVNEGDHVLPSSFECAKRTSYAYVSGPLFCNQWATSSPPASRMTEGTSAQFTNQSVPDATSRAVDQPDAPRSENRSVAFGPSRSIQLRSRPRSEDDSCGCALFGPAGDAVRSSCGCQAETAG